MNAKLEALVDLICEMGASDLCVEARTMIRRANRPGPVIAVVGGEGRGKSTLIHRIAGLEEFPTARIVYGPEWTHTDLRDLPIIGSRCASEQLEDVVIIEAHSFDRSFSEGNSTEIVKAADLVLFIVQSTSPGSEEEVRYAQHHLEGKPSLLVLSKADLAEEELDDAFEFALRAFDGTPWMGAFISGAVNGRLRVEDWWQSSGLDTARKARLHILESKSGLLADAGLEFIESKVERLSSMETNLGASARKSESVREIYKLKSGIRSDLRRIPRLAVEVFEKQRGSYATGFRAILNEVLAVSDPFVEIDFNHLAEDLNEFLIGWDTDARSAVRDSLRPEIESLFAKASRISSLLSSLEMSNFSPLKVLRKETEADGGLFYAPNINLSEAEKRRAVVSPILSGGGTTLLGHTLLAFMGPVSWIIGAAAGIGVLTLNRTAQDEQNRRKLLLDLERAMTLQSSQVFNELAERFARDWRTYAFYLESQLAPALRAADIAEKSEPDRMDGLDELREVRKDLVRWLNLRDKLSRWAAG